MPAPLAKMHDEIHRLQSRVVALLSAAIKPAESAALMAELRECLGRAEWIATDHQDDHAHLRLLRTAIKNLGLGTTG